MKVYNYLSKNLDKVAHFLVCLLIAYVVAVLDVKYFARDVAVAGTIGALTAVFVGIVKEVLDFFRRADFSTKDLLADALGAVAGTALFLILC